jgi:hypothetical protein
MEVTLIISEVIQRPVAGEKQQNVPTARGAITNLFVKPLGIRYSPLRKHRQPLSVR